MIEVIVDRDDENYQNGATFYFEKVDEDLIKFIDLCFKHNNNREMILFREVDRCRDI